MSTQLNANEIKQQVSIADLLTQLGFQPINRSGKELFYLSMLRDSDRSPSFCVNPDLNVWFDHGTGKGGNIIDFGLLYWKGLSFAEVLLKLHHVSGSLIILESNARNKDKQRPRKFIKLPHYKVENIKPLGSNPAITSYLDSRGVLSVGRNQLQEVYYYVEDEKKQRKQFFAAGWQNENGGWEVRNKYFKGCLGKKGLTFIPGKEQKLVVFEGFLDYLSWLYEHQSTTDSVLVLNSLSFLAAAIKRAGVFPAAEVFFDHDDAGRKATIEFLNAVPQAKDSSSCYAGYTDYNEKLMTEISELCTLKPAVKPTFLPNLKVGFSR
ncbi:toprim domain-containing protein [Pedobacter sp. P351]|uniref:toprim domain-containing protein n=1 Tax=Pedobacter superstes TaxID=3133441 RepID=UPI003095F9F1